MTDEEFWNLIEEINWARLVDEEPGNAVDVGKNFLMERFPSETAFAVFTTKYTIFRDSLHAKLTAYSMQRFDENKEAPNPSNWAGWGVGDDGFGDLISHIIGCGKKTYDDTMQDPSLAVERINKAFAKFNMHKVNNYAVPFRPSDGFVEKFSYCFPNDLDYRPLEEKLEDSRQSLKAWLAKAIEKFDDSTDASHKQVARDLAEIILYTDLIKVGTVGPKIVRATPEQINEQIEPARIMILKKTFALLAKNKIDIIYHMKQIQDELDTLMSKESK